MKSAKQGSHPRCAATLRVGGLTPLSATDYPGHLSSVVFCQGCPWRCGYCHNPHLLARHGAVEIAWAEVLAFLKRRRGLLDAVVFSGGEPTLQTALPEAMRDVKALDFKIGLHTAGISPHRLAAVLPLLDWVGLDVKAPFGEYEQVTGAAGSGARARASLDLVLASGVDYELRTTVNPALLPPRSLDRIAATLAARGARRFVVQEFRAAGCPDVRLHDARPCFTDEYCRGFAGLFPSFSVRRAA